MTLSFSHTSEVLIAGVLALSLMLRPPLLRSEPKAAAAKPLAATASRERVSFNADWRFQKGDPAGFEGQLSYDKIKGWISATGSDFGTSNSRPAEDPGSDVPYVKRDFKDSAWRKLNLPHDWGIEGPFAQENPGETGRLPWWGNAWYRKHFTVRPEEKGRRFYLDIDGAMAYASVWLNGRYIGGWPYGYASFQLDLTPGIAFGGENVISIRLDNPPDSSRWYPGGGLYRNVWLVKTAPVHTGHWGTYVTTPEVSEASATVKVKETVENHSKDAAEVSVRTEIYELDGTGKKLKTPAATMVTTARIAAGGRELLDKSLKVGSPKLWSTERPNLYKAVTRVMQGSPIVDEYESTFGIRTIKFDADKGFFLNGKLLRINGVGYHHDLGLLARRSICALSSARSSS